MTIKVKASRFRIRRSDPAAVAPPPASNNGDGLLPMDDGFGPDPFPTARTAAPAQPLPPEPTAEPAIDAIRREGLTGRQLRLARRVAMKNGLPATSDFDAVRLLRAAGIDPFQRNSVLELVASDATAPQVGSRELQKVPGDGNRLPQTVKPLNVPTTDQRAEQNLAADVMKIQRDMARRRKKRLAALTVRMFFFVFLPTIFAGIYYFVIATPMYSTRSEFVIQQAEPKGLGLGGLFSGTPLAASQDSIAVQGYLQSRDAMQRLDADFGFRAHFTQPDIDPLQRLAPDATTEAAYKIYKRNVKIAYDPTEGLIRMDVIAADPTTAAAFSRALIGYAEEQVDNLTRRLREDQMQGARESYAEAEKSMLDAERKLVEIQQKTKTLSSEAEAALISQQVAALETRLTQDRLSLAEMEANAEPNQARMEPLKQRMVALESEIAGLRAKLTIGDENGQSLAEIQSELLVAKANVETRQMLLAQSLQSLETSRIEANRQVRYLSLSVSPVVSDEAAYPRSFENTMVAMMIFAGIYLMISMTAAILREQVSA
jgi:capsular polysaccharide transport system permease protein